MENPDILFLDWAKQNLSNEKYAFAMKMEEHNKSLTDGHNGRMVTDLDMEIKNLNYHYTYPVFDDYCWEKKKNGIYSLGTGQFIIAGHGIKHEIMENIKIGGS